MWTKLACLLAALTVFAVACDSDPSPFGEPDKPFTVRLANAGTEPVHLFIIQRGETFPCCQVAPDGVRVVTLNAAQDEDWDFHAGRNGQILDTVRCSSRGLEQGAVVRVIWSDLDQRLACLGW